MAQRFIKRIYTDKATGKKTYTVMRAKDDYQLKDNPTEDRFGREYTEEEHNPSKAGQMARGVAPALLGTGLAAMSGKAGGVGFGLNAAGQAATNVMANQLQATRPNSKLAAMTASGLSTSSSLGTDAYQKEFNRTGSTSAALKASALARGQGLVQGAISAIPGGKSIGRGVGGAAAGFMRGGWQGALAGFAQSVMTSPTLGNDVKNLMTKSTAANYNEGTWGSNMPNVEEEEDLDTRSADIKAKQEALARQKLGLPPLPQPAAAPPAAPPAAPAAPPAAPPGAPAAPPAAPPGAPAAPPGAPAAPPGAPAAPPGAPAAAPAAPPPPPPPPQLPVVLPPPEAPIVQPAVRAPIVQPPVPAPMRQPAVPRPPAAAAPAAPPGAPAAPPGAPPGAPGGGGAPLEPIPDINDMPEYDETSRTVEPLRPAADMPEAEKTPEQVDEDVTRAAPDAVPEYANSAAFNEPEQQADLQTEADRNPIPAAGAMPANPAAREALPEDALLRQAGILNVENVTGAEPNIETNDPETDELLGGADPDANEPTEEQILGDDKDAADKEEAATQEAKAEERNRAALAAVHAGAAPGGAVGEIAPQAAGGGGGGAPPPADAGGGGGGAPPPADAGGGGGGAPPPPGLAANLLGAQPGQDINSDQAMEAMRRIIAAPLPNFDDPASIEQANAQITDLLDTYGGGRQPGAEPTPNELIEQHMHRHGLSREDAEDSMPTSFYLEHPQLAGKYRSVQTMQAARVQEGRNANFFSKDSLVKGANGAPYIQTPFGLLKLASDNVKGANRNEKYQAQVKKLQYLVRANKMDEAKRLYDLLPRQDRGIEHTPEEQSRIAHDKIDLLTQRMSNGDIDPERSEDLDQALNQVHQAYASVPRERRDDLRQKLLDAEYTHSTFRAAPGWFSNRRGAPTEIENLPTRNKHGYVLYDPTNP